MLARRHRFYIVKYVTFPYGDFQGCCGLYFVQYAIWCPSRRVHTTPGPLPAPKNISHAEYFLSFPLNFGTFYSNFIVSHRTPSCPLAFLRLPSYSLMFAHIAVSLRSCLSRFRVRQTTMLHTATDVMHMYAHLCVHMNGCA